jgi:branched-subunit amino acid aminotransferase/4-amino-4-deoxychorismate lyase
MIFSAAKGPPYQASFRTMSNESRLDLRVNFNRTRAFLYGESVFTTIRVEEGRPLFEKWHFERLLKSAEWLWPNTAQQAQSLIENLRPPGLRGVWRLTLTAQVKTRDSQDEMELILDDWWSEDIPEAKELILKNVKSPARPESWPSFLKSGDYLSRMVASRHLKSDEVPLFHVENKICELLHANIFFIRDQKMITPPLSNNTLEGLGRRRVLQMFKVEECELNVDELTQISSAFGVNALRGIMPVEKIDGKKLERHPIINELQREFFRC